MLELSLFSLVTEPGQLDRGYSLTLFDHGVRRGAELLCVHGFGLLPGLPVAP